MVAPRTPKAQRCVVEALEPKLLYSADITPLAFMPAPSAALISTPSMASMPVNVSTVLPASSEIVFIDTSVTDSASLIKDLHQQAGQGRALEVVLIDPKEDGITRISETLAGRHDISAIHLIGHGITGQAQLGSAELNTDNLLTRANEVANWAQALTANADLLIYGCDVGASADGQALVDGLAHLTGADVAASADNTGLKALGGNWQLEVTSGGAIDALLAPSLDVQGNWQQLLAAPTTVAENTSYVGRVPPQFVFGNYYSLDNTYQDSNKFTVNGAGDVSFSTAPNFELPIDGNGDNTYMIKVVVTDGGLLSKTIVYQIDVTDVDEAPVITSNGAGATAILSTPESTLSGAMFQYVTTVIASDPEGANVQYSISGGSDAGRFILFGNVLLFTFAPNFEAPTDTGADNQYQVTLQATDATNHSDTQTLYINVTNVNEPPSIISNGGGNTGNASVVENTKNVTTVVGKDPDANTTLEYTIINGADRQLFDLDKATGALTFHDAPNFEAPTDSNHDNVYEVYVQVSEKSQGSGVPYTKSQQLFVSVLNANEPPTITSNGAGTNATTAVFENATDVTTVTATDPDAGARLSYSISGADAGKFVIDSSTGVLKFLSPPDYETSPHQYNLVVQVADQANGIDTQSLRINLNNVDEPPRITSNGGGPTATVYVAEGTTSVTTVIGADVDTNSLHYSIVGGADAAAFDITSAGVLTLKIPPVLPTPADTIIYEVTVQVSDGTSDVRQTIFANVIHVNSPPVIENQARADQASMAINENQNLDVTIVATDADAGTKLSYAIMGGADAAQFTINAQTGLLEFVSVPDFELPTDSDLNNVYDVIVSASDGPESDTQQWTITVNNINDAPVALDDASFEINEDESLNTLALTLGPNSVLGNDTDQDSARTTLTATLEQTTANGSLSLAADGSFIYTPSADFNGTDSFTYTVSDGQAVSAPATVTITVHPVNDAPVANADNDSINEDTTLSGNVLSNDLDVDGDLLTASNTTTPLHGDLIFNVDGSYTYTPATNFFGTDSFTYTVDDGQGGSATGTVTITVIPVNDSPIGVDSALAATEDTAVTGSVAGQVTDIEADPLTFTLVNSNGETTNGQVQFRPDGSFTYTPNANFHGQDQFVYYASDGQSRSNDTTVTIDVASVNDAPVALDDTATTDEDTPVSGNVLSNDSDVDDPALTMALISGPSHGQLQWESAGNYTYTPDADFNGSDSFTYKALDALGSQATATMTITINAINDAPTLTHSGSTQVHVEGGPATLVDGTWSIADVDSPDLTGATVAIAPSQFKPGEDVLAVSSSTAIQGTYDANTGVLTLTGTASLADYQAALRSVTYTNTSDNPDTTTRTLTFTVDDGGAVNHTCAADQAVSMTAINDAPVVSHTANSPSFIENGPAILVDATINLSDPDNTALVGASVAISPGQGEDVLAFTAQNGIEGTFDAGTGVLTLTGAASVADYQAALRSVTYANTSDNPDTTTRTVTFTVDDGEAVNHTGNVVQLITLVAVNDAPAISHSSASLQFTENSPALAVDASINLSDLDSTALVSATVAISPSQYRAGEDVLAFANQNGIQGVFDAGTGVLTLTGTAPLADYQAALRSITYANTSDNPDTTTRTVTFTVDDGGGVDHIGTLNQYVLLTATNDAPVISHSNTGLQYTENSPSVAVDATINLTDLDSANLVGATVTISPSQYKATEDVLAFATQNGIQGTFDAGTGVLTLTGSASLANYQAALRSVTYANTSDNPDTTTRTVTFTIDDGAGVNHTGSIDQRLALTAINDAPVVVRNALTITQGQSALPDLVITDVDSPSSSIQITATAVTAGHFIDVTTGGAVSAFSLADLQAGHILFAHDSSNVQPSYQLDVSDGQSTYTVSGVNVTFNPFFVTVPAADIAPPTIGKQADKQTDNTPSADAESSKPNPADSNTAQALGLIVQTPGESADATGTPTGGALMMDSGALGSTGLWGLPASGYGLATRFTIDTFRPKDWHPESTPVSTDAMAGSYTWTGFLQSGEAPQTLRRNLETLRNQLMDQESGRHQVIASTIAMSTGLSVGYVIWLVRGGALLGSMLSTMPMWQMIDPLPVLTRSASGKRKDNDEPADDRSVEQIFDGQQHEPTPPPVPPTPPGGIQKLTTEATT